MDAMTLPNADAVIARAKRGDPVALEQVYHAYSGPAYNLARRICRTTSTSIPVPIALRKCSDRSSQRAEPTSTGASVPAASVAIASASVPLPGTIFTKSLPVPIGMSPNAGAGAGAASSPFATS